MSNVKAKIKTLHTRADSWANVLTGVGTARDKIRQGQFISDGVVDDVTSDSMFHEDDIAERICTMMPEYALRKTPLIKVKPDDSKSNSKSKTDLNEEAQKVQSEANDKFEALEASDKMEEAAIWANVFGGCILLLGIDDGVPYEEWEKPLDEDNIKAFTHMNVIDRRYVTPMTWYSDSRKPKFNTPETYAVTPFEVRMETLASDLLTQGVSIVHESRMLVFGGMRTSITRRRQNRGWEDSLITRVYKVLKQFGQSWDVLPALISDGNQAVFKMKGLIEAIAADEENLVHKRLELLDLNRSALRAVACDADDESYERAPMQWAGIREPFELLQARLSVAAKAPITKIFGRSPAGENATGESDATNFQDEVEAYQKSRFKKPFNRIAYLIFKSKDGPTMTKVPENWDTEFPPLKSTTDKEKADIANVMADADAKNVASGILDPDEVAVSRFGSADGFSLETSINVDSRRPPQKPEDFDLPTDPNDFGVTKDGSDGGELDNSGTQSTSGDKGAELKEE